MELLPPHMILKNLQLIINDHKPVRTVFDADVDQDENNYIIYVSRKIISDLSQNGKAYAETSYDGQGIHFVNVAKEKNNCWLNGSAKENIRIINRFMASQKWIVGRNEVLDNYQHLFKYKPAPSSGLLLARIYGRNIDSFLTDKHMANLREKGRVQGFAISPREKRKFSLIIDDKLARQDFSFGANLVVDDEDDVGSGDKLSVKTKNSATLYLTQDAGNTFLETGMLKRKYGKKWENTATITRLPSTVSKEKSTKENMMYEQLEYYARKLK